MGSIIKVNEYKDFGNNAIMTSDGSGNLTTQNISEPCLKVIRASSNQTSVSSATYTKVQFNSEDTDVTASGTWDSTNYRWTPGLSGKYFLSLNIELVSASDTAKQCQMLIYKNGSILTYAYLNMNAFDLRSGGSQALGASAIDYANSTDYYEGFVYMQVNSGTASVRTSNENTNFCGHRIGS